MLNRIPMVYRCKKQLDKVMKTKAFVAEFISTFALIFIDVGAVATNYINRGVAAALLYHFVLEEQLRSQPIASNEFARSER